MADRDPGTAYERLEHEQIPPVSSLADSLARHDIGALVSLLRGDTRPCRLASSR